MNFVGDEKRIQTLFREMKLEDRRVLPDFDRLWNEPSSATVHVMGQSLIALASTLALVIVTLFFFASFERTLEIPKLAISEVSPTINVQTPEPPTQLTAHRRRPQRLRSQILRNAVALSSWRSPTAGLMQSRGGTGIDSLPQLNQAAKELQSFLPAN